MLLAPFLKQLYTSKQNQTFDLLSVGKKKDGTRQMAEQNEKGMIEMKNTKNTAYTNTHTQK